MLKIFAILFTLTITIYFKSSSERAAGGGSSSARSAAAGKADDVVSDDEDAAAESAAPEVDPWELLEPVDIVPLIARDFYTVLESKKWLERKGALDGVHQLLVDNPRLTAKGNINDLVKALSTVSFIFLTEVELYGCIFPYFFWNFKRLKKHKLDVNVILN